MKYALNHYWFEITILPQAVLKHMVSRSFNVNKSMHGINSVSHMSVTSGLLCGVVGQLAGYDLLSVFQGKIS